MIDSKTLSRFECKIDKEIHPECWIWESATDGRYGFFWLNRKNALAHRLSYEIYIGEIPSGMHVCHKCDNGLCVNPKHLFLGTAKDNVRDCMQKKRRAPQHGSFNPRAKLSYAIIPEIFAMRKAGMLQKNIALRVGVNREAIGKILRKERWTGGSCDQQWRDAQSGALTAV